MKNAIVFRASEEEIAKWKQAAGDVPLSKWIRGLLNGASEPVRAKVDVVVRKALESAVPRLCQEVTGEKIQLSAYH